MTFEIKFDIGDVVQFATHDEPPARFFDGNGNKNKICGVVIGIQITHTRGILYAIRRDTRNGATTTAYAEWQLELVPTAPSRTEPQ